MLCLFPLPFFPMLPRGRKKEEKLLQITKAINHTRETTKRQIVPASNYSEALDRPVQPVFRVLRRVFLLFLCVVFFSSLQQIPLRSSRYIKTLIIFAYNFANLQVGKSKLELLFKNESSQCSRHVKNFLSR